MEIIRRKAVINIIVILLFLLVTYFIFSFFSVRRSVLIYKDYYLKIDNVLSSGIDCSSGRIIDDFIVGYQYNDKYIGVKAIVKSDYNVIYYLIDTEIDYLYGPYFTEDEYLAVQGVFSSEMLSDWYLVNELD